METKEEKTPRVCLAEDEAIIAMTLKIYLEEMGYNVLGMAVTGEGIYNNAKMYHPDVILMDINMDYRRAGIDAAKKIKKEFDIPIIFVTAYTDELTQEDIWEITPYGFIQKPINPKALKPVIETAVFHHNIMEKNLELINRHEILFNNVMNGAAYHRIKVNNDGTPIDYEFLMVNESFEQMTGLKKEDILGKLLTEVLPGIEKTWIEIYGEVALTGKPVEFIMWTNVLKRLFHVYAFSTRKYFFGTIFEEIIKGDLDYDRYIKRAKKGIIPISKFNGKNSK